MSNQISTQTIQFYNHALITFEQNGTHYTAMKPICENIGLDWKAQHSRIQRDEVLSQGILMIRTPSNGGEQQMLCLPIEYLNGWLFGIDIKRCKPEIRETLIRYKKECYQALANYWLKGKAERQTAVKIERLSTEHQSTIKELVLGRAKALPKDQQAGVIIKQWSALKTHFGKSYKDIDDSQFVEAVSLLARLPLEGELIINEPEGTFTHTHTESDLRNLGWLWFEAFKMKEFINQIRPALEAIGSKFEPTAYSCVAEYGPHINYVGKHIYQLIKDVDFEQNLRPLKTLEEELKTPTKRIYR
ncbi:phage antirepressor N-terminal domain-containing protein [Lonepinella sp. MS14436]|uniref:phage antirepressor N-terminal domain-containing protein n=1 Tax=Lonepinella sp. MS14436 TaxID=3003619 RepID=UPI0036DEE5FB